MLPHRFAYHRAQQLDQAFDLLDRHGEDAALYAGGTELLLALKARVLRYEHLIDIKPLPLRGVRVTGNEVRIGALSTHHSLATDPLVSRYLPAYAKLSNEIANIRVRVAGTLGGNLCFAEPHADPPALLAAMNATFVLRGPSGDRVVAASEFIQSEFTTTRAHDEILTEVRVPIAVSGERFAYKSFGQHERPSVGIAVAYLPRNGTPGYRFWAGAIAAAPTRLTSLEAALDGVPPQSLGDVLPSASVAATDILEANDDLQGSADYKRHLASVLIRRALSEATGITADMGSPHGNA
jgi:carbon-monoxide dehydrogenase medium subunit